TRRPTRTVERCHARARGWKQFTERADVSQRRRRLKSLTVAELPNSRSKALRLSAKSSGLPTTAHRPQPIQSKTLFTSYLSEMPEQHCITTAPREPESHTAQLNQIRRANFLVLPAFRFWF